MTLRRKVRRRTDGGSTKRKHYDEFGGVREWDRAFANYAIKHGQDPDEFYKNDNFNQFQGEK